MTHLDRASLLLLAVVACAPGRAAAQATVAGVVYDSLRTVRPLSGAVVLVTGAGRTAESDSRGRYVIRDLPRGTWDVTFFHPMLDSLGLGAPIRRIDVGTSGTVHADLATPSGPAVYAMLCGAPRDIGLGVVIGFVRTTEGASANRVTVETDWNEFDLRDDGWHRARLTARAPVDSTGRFTLCNVPVDLSLEVFVRRDTVDLSGPAWLALGGVTVARADFLVGLPQTFGGIAGRVSSRGRGMREAVVVVRGMTGEWRTDSDGRYRIEGVASGTRGVEVRAIGFAPARVAVSVEPAATALLETDLDEIARLLPEAVVLGQRRTTDRNGFLERSRGGIGRFMAGADIARRRPVFFRDVLRMNGLTPLGTPRGVRYVLRGEGGGACTPNYFVDGFRWLSSGMPGSSAQDDLDTFILPGDIAAIEVYTSQTSTPGRFSTPLSTCGTVVVWTQR